MWHESDFERWFLTNPTLPGGEPLVPIAQQSTLRRVVDLLCFDARGGLVLIEVKNETSSRTIIGQALEYLSQYEDAQIETLLEDLSTERAAEVVRLIEAKGWQISEIARHRRVYLAAPGFDFPTQ